MPGIATLFQALELTTNRLQSDPQLSGFADIIKAHNGYAHLGVLGPSLGDFLPADPVPGVQPANYVRIWKNIFQVLGDREEGRGLRSTLAALRDGLNDLKQIADDEDAFALGSFDADSLKAAGDDLQRLVGMLEDKVSNIGMWIARELKPKVNTLAPMDPTPPPTEWQSRDVLSWKKTGVFVRKLLNKADATSDDRLKAYAYGYMIGYACRVCCSPFINSIVGGAFRTQWWRQRFVRNFVDAWVHGFYRLSPRPTIDPADVPSVPYANWPLLCDAKLYTKLNLDDTAPIDDVALLDTVGQGQQPPTIVPTDFSQRWFEALQETYGAAVPVNVTAQSLNGAYVMTYLMLWFQTSGAVLGVLGCRPEEPSPPGDCGKDPKELDPFQTDDDGKPMKMPDANIDDDIDEEWVVCGFILSLFNPLSTLSGAISGGSRVPGIGTLIADAAVDWDQLRCHLWWYREYMYNAIAGFQRLTTLSGFAYPDPKVFADDKLVLDLVKIKKDLESARSLVKGRLRSSFPSKVWIIFDPNDPADTDDDKFFIKLFNNFLKDPDATAPGFESPNTVANLVEAYPSFFLDDPSNPLTAGDVKTGGPFPSREGRFGSVVDNAIDLFAHLNAHLPNWNLDADRGLGWLTWQFKGGYDPNAVQVEPES
jgi:hypothetical protein